MDNYTLIMHSSITRVSHILHIDDTDAALTQISPMQHIHT